MKRVRGKEVVLVLDNLRVHYGIEVNEFLKENNVEVIWTLPYTPIYSWIEMAFS